MLPAASKGYLFEIGGISYSDEPEDFSFEIVGAEVQGEEDEVVEGEDEEEYEDLSPEELAEEIGKFLSFFAKYVENLRRKWLVGTTMWRRTRTVTNAPGAVRTLI